jgi:glutamine amidotransferase
MKELKRLDLAQLVREEARRKPLLGICLGMQVLLDHSEENEGVDALAVVPGKVVRFKDPPGNGPNGENLKVPHVGWNRVKQARSHPLWAGVPDNSWFYFVHSYNVAPKNKKHVLGTADYTHTFTAALARENIAAFQFHPEKSQGAGMTLLANFVGWNGES